SASGRLTIDQLVDIRHPSNPMWSPDGRHVAFAWDRAGLSNVYVADVSGGAGQPGAPRLLSEAGATLAGAFWSADRRPPLHETDGALWGVPIHSGAASPVRTTPQAELGIAPSPDRMRVAFIRLAAADASSPAAAGRGGRGGRGGGGGGPTELWVRS